MDKTLYYLNTDRYQNSLVSDKYSKNFEWVKDRFDLPTYYTFSSLDEIGKAKEENVILLESSAIIPHQVEWVKQNAYKFANIYTHNSALLSAFPNTRWIPGGGIWIGGEWGGGEIKVYPKTKLCSMVSSNKTMCQMHVARLMMAQYCQSYMPFVDLYGTAFGGFTKAIDTLKDYKFSIVVENYVDKLYFTEKILNCFATGTIPIYYGAQNISKAFNSDGIIQIFHPSHLSKIREFISDEFYESRKEAIEENLNRALKFECIEDYMWENYINHS